MDYEKSMMMHNGIGFLIAVLMIFFMAVGIGSIINRETKNPKTDTGVDTTAMSLIKIVDCFTELNKNLEELIEAQKKQNEAMKQEFNSRIENKQKKNIFEEMPELWIETATISNDLLYRPPAKLNDGMFKGHFYLASDSVVYKEGN